MHDPGQDEGYDNELDMYMDEEEEYEEYMDSEAVNEDDFITKSEIQSQIKQNLIDKENLIKNS